MCQPSRDERTQGEWNACVVNVKTLKECRARIAEVPERLRAQAESYARTVFELRRKSRSEVKSST